MLAWVVYPDADVPGGANQELIGAGRGEIGVRAVGPYECAGVVRLGTSPRGEAVEPRGDVIRTTRDGGSETAGGVVPAPADGGGLAESGVVPPPGDAGADPAARGVGVAPADGVLSPSRTA